MSTWVPFFSSRLVERASEWHASTCVTSTSVTRGREKRQAIPCHLIPQAHSLPYTPSYILIVNFLFFLLLLFRMCPDLAPKWFKFDDGEVSECKMDDDEVLATCWCSYSRLLAVSLFSVVRRAKRGTRKWPRAWLMARDGGGCRPRFARLAASPLPRACIALTKSSTILL